MLHFSGFLLDVNFSAFCQMSHFSGFLSDVTLFRVFVRCYTFRGGFVICFNFYICFNLPGTLILCVI